MTLTLLLIRHATALPARGDQPDEDRALAPEGREEARRMGAWVAAQGLAPEEAICSTARRTRETLDLMAAAWPPGPRARHEGALYAAGPEAALALLGASEARVVALVGHNPTMRFLAESLARGPRRGGYPPATVAALRFEAEGWEGIRAGRGEVVAFARPSDVP